jgi:hypothetical protein
MGSQPVAETNQCETVPGLLGGSDRGPSNSLRVRAKAERRNRYAAM